MHLSRFPRIALAHLGGRQIDGRRPDEIVQQAEYRRPTDLPIRGSVDVQLGRLLYGTHDLTDVSLTLIIADSALHVSETFARRSVQVPDSTSQAVESIGKL